MAMNTNAYYSIKRQYGDQELSYIDAIQALERLGYSSIEAEATVIEWDEENDD